MTDDMVSLRAALAAAFDADQVLRELDAIPVDRPLAARLVDTVHALDAYHGRIRDGGDAVLRSVEAMARDTGTAGKTQAGPLMSPDDVRAIDRTPEIREAVARVFEPDQEHLRLPPAALADAFLRMVSLAVRALDPQRPPLPAEQVVDLFLYGAAIR
jgi:hypothetical protein